MVYFVKTKEPLKKAENAVQRHYKQLDGLNQENGTNR